MRQNARPIESNASPAQGETETLAALEALTEVWAERAATPRRGPLRPGELTPTRTRLLGKAVSAAVRGFDILAVAVISLACARLAPALPIACAAAAVVLALGAGGAYRFPANARLVDNIVRSLAAFAVGPIVLALFGAASPVNLQTIDGWSLWAGATLTALVFIHTAAWLMIRHWRTNGLLTPNLVIVGATPGAERLIAHAMDTGEAAVLGVFDDRRARIGPDVLGVPVLGDTAALLTHRIMPCIDRVVITVAPSARVRVDALVERLSFLPNPISILLDDGAPDAKASLSQIAGLNLGNLSGRPNDEARAVVKRLMDLVIGAVGLVMVSPVMLAVALAVKLDSPGPIFFRQKRHGFNNEEILVWKFRSMRHATADATASQQVRAGDDRVTRVGKLIRKTSLDELPQLFNVLAGEMSLVGPRPHAIGMKSGDTESAKLVAHYAHRHRMKPGVTGWAAIKGSRGPVDTPELVRRRVALDIEYIERQSFWLDLYIIAMTVPCLLGDKDAIR